MPIWFPKPFVDRATDVGRQLGRRNIRSPKLGEMWRAYSSLAGAPNRTAFVRTMRGIIDPGGQMVNALDRLYLAAHLPTLIIWGDQDGIIPVEHAYAAHEAIETSTLEILEGVGHFPHVESPEVFTDVLLDFMESTKPASTRHEALRDVLIEGS